MKTILGNREHRNFEMIVREQGKLFLGNKGTWIPARRALLEMLQQCKSNKYP